VRVNENISQMDRKTPLAKTIYRAIDRKSTFQNISARNKPDVMMV